MRGWVSSVRCLAVSLIVLLCAAVSVFAEEKLAQGGKRPSLEQLTAQYTQLFKDGKYAEALALAQSAVAEAEKRYGAENPAVAQALNDLGVLYSRVDRQAEAALAHQQALAIRRRAFQADGAEVAQSLGNLAKAYQAQRRFADAEPLYAELLAILSKNQSAGNARVADLMSRYAACLRENGKTEQAAVLEAIIKQTENEQKQAGGP